jgi:hypothetical protein
MTPAIHHMASAQAHTDALREARRAPRLPDVEKPARAHRRRTTLLRRLRPALG